MIRRRFLQFMTLATARSLAPLVALADRARKIVSYRVQGFSCTTCATGLDTMLGQRKGIVSSQSIYPEGKVTVVFNPEQITEKAIVAFITDLGFTVADECKGNTQLTRKPVLN